MADSAFALTLAVVVAAIYLVLLRLVDHNEKEPLWAMLLLLVLGAVGAAVLSVLVHARTLHGTVVLASLADEITIFIAIAVGIGLLEAIGSVRGWSEVNGVLDGIVYGGAVGLGFAVGEAFVRELHNTGLLNLAIDSSPLDTLWPTLLAGLALGAFGSLIGAAFGAAIDRSGTSRILLPAAGLAVACVVQIGYLALAHGNALGGTQAKFREWLALGIPALFFLLLSLRALRSERGAIAAKLAGDPLAATPEELDLLTHPAARRAAYIRRFATLDSHGWLGLRSLQNRQVQLALTMQRAERTSDPRRRTELQAEVQRLRAAVAAARQHLAAGSGSPTALEGQS